MLWCGTIAVLDASVRLMSSPVRLSKFLAAQLPCSRREAELYIEGGWVLVDGLVIEQPQFKVTGRERVELRPGASPEAQPAMTLLLHKPSGYRSDIVPRAGGDPADDSPSAGDLLVLDRRSVDDSSGIQPLARHFTGLTVPLPLEFASAGMLVVTQDPAVARKLTEHAARIEQEFIVEVAGRIAADGLERLRQGFRFNGTTLASAKVSWQNETRLRFALKGVQAGQIAHMCGCVNLQAIDIKRIRIGAVPMARLSAGQWRYLTPGTRF